MTSMRSLRISMDEKKRVNPDLFLDPGMRAHVRIYHDPWPIGDNYYCSQDGEPWPCKLVAVLQQREIFEDYMDDSLKESNLYRKKKKGKDKK